MACSASCRSEFKPRHFLLDYETPGHFTHFQCGYARLYVAWRLFWALYHTVWIIVSGLMSYQWAGPDSSQYVKWFIYLTDWSYFMLALSDVVSFLAVVYVFRHRDDLLKCCPGVMPWYLKTAWVLFNVANSASFVTGALYWTLLYSAGTTVTAVDAETHAVNIVYVFINLLVVGTPVRVYHFFHPVVYGVVFWLFTVFYFLAGGTDIKGNPYVYSVLDWREPGTAAMYVGLTSFVALPLAHVIMYLGYLLRITLLKHCCKNDVSVENAGDRTKNDVV